MRKLMWCTIGFAAACALGAYFYWDHIWIVAVVAAVLCIASFFLRRKVSILRQTAAVLAGIALGVGWFSCYELFYLDAVRASDKQTVQTVVITSDLSYATGYGCAVEGKLRLDGENYPAIIYLDEEKELSPGDEIVGSFYLKAVFDGSGTMFKAYPASQVHYRYAETIPALYFPAQLRRTLIQTIEAMFPEDTAFFAKALLLGDRSDVGYEVDTAFKVTGISHIIAVSGLHVSILFSLVYLFSGKRRWLTALLGIPTVLLFTAVAGFTPSITRACLMQILMMLALLMDKEYDPPTALAFAVLVMLVKDPLVIASVSFQLSVGCMAGIFLFSGRIQSWMVGLTFWKAWKGKTMLGRSRQWICSGVAVTLSSMFFTTPLVAVYFGAVSLVGIITNLLTLWVVTFIFYGIMAVCLLGLLWEGGATAVAWLVSWPIRYVLGVSGLLSRSPLTAVYTCSVYIVFWLVLCYVLVMVFLFSKQRQPCVLLCCASLGLCAALLLSWVEPLLDDVRMTVLDVGQGQCILIQASGRSFLVDCGGDSDTATADLAAETLLAQGVGRLDGLVLTHFDRDHAGGAAKLLSRIPADAVYLPDTEDPDSLLEDIIAACDGSEIFVRQDLKIRWGSAEMTVFAPVLSTSSNESGLSVLFQGENCDILITGDMSTLGEALLVQQKELPELTALVAGHHGSKSSTGEGLLEATHPSYVFISVGEGNSYGHPSAQVLERLEEYGCMVYRTDEDGTITFRR